MSVKAGTAYIEIVLAGVAPLKKQISSQVESATGAAAAKASAALTKNMSGKQAAQKIASDIASGLAGIGGAITKPFVSGLKSAMNIGAVDSAKSFGLAFSQNLGAFLKVGSGAAFLSSMKELGISAASSLSNAVMNGVKGLPGTIAGIFKNVGAGISQVAGGVVSAFASIPKILSTVSSGIQSFSRQLGFAAYQAQNMGLTMSVAFTAPVAAIGILGTAIGVKFAVQVEDAKIGLKSLLPVGYDVASLIQRLQQLAIKSPVFDTASVITFTQRMVAAGLQINKVERFLAAFGNIAVTVGVPMDKVTLALEAFSQMAGKGVVNMEELRQQLGDALPGALKIAADGLGVTQAKLFEMVRKGEVTADMLLGAFIKVGESATYVQGAAAGADTLRSRWNQLVETVQTKLGNLILQNMDTIKKALSDAQPGIDRLLKVFSENLPAAIEWIGKASSKIGELIDRYDKLDEGDRKLIKTLSLLAVVGGPAIAILGTFAAAIAAIASAFSLLISPAGLVIAAIVVAVIELKVLWEWLQNLYDRSEAFRNIVDKVVAVFRDNLMPAFREAAQVIKTSFIQAFEQVRNELIKNKDNLEGLKTLLQAVGAVILAVIGIVIGVVLGLAKAIGPALIAVSSLITGVMQVLIGVVNFIYHLFTGNFKALDKDVRTIWNGLWDAIVGTLVNLGKAALAFISGFVEGFIGFFKGMYDILVGHSIVPDLVDAIISLIASLPGRVLGFISSLVSGVISYFSSMASNVVSGIANLANNVVSYMAGLPGRILGAIGNLGGALFSVGQNMISGLLNGLSSMAGSVIDKARSIASSVKKTIENALDIKSPSRVMMGIGENVVKGLVLGITGQISDMTYAIDRALSGVTAEIAASGMSSIINVEAGEPKRAATLYIENYTAPLDTSPDEQAEKWAWLNNSRGW